MLDSDLVNNNNNKNQDSNQEVSFSQIEEMYKAGVHFGYSRSSCHPKMQPYLFGLRNNVEIFNLEKVFSCLEKAGNFLKGTGVSGKKILLVATKPEVSEIAREKAEKFQLSYVTERWLGGILTNFKVIRGRIDQYENLKRRKEASEFLKLTKKEAARLEKKLISMETKFGGLVLLKELPAVLLVLDPKKESAAVAEAKKEKIPVVAILNSDCDPSLIDFPVPGNDASLASVQYLFDKLLVAYDEGRKAVNTSG